MDSVPPPPHGKLGIVLPWSSPFMFSLTVDSLLNLRHPHGIELRHFRSSGWCPAARHINGCAAAMRWGADLILILGTDQVYDEDLLCRLVARWKEGYEVVSALVPARGFVGWQQMQPFQPMAWRLKANAPGDLTYRVFGGQHDTPDLLEAIDPKAGNMQRIHFIGSGVLLFHRDHLLALKRPWFSEMVDPLSYNRLANMDCRFVWRLHHEAHAQVWVDTTIKVKHLHVFPIDETYSARFADWAEPGQGDPTICRYAAPHDGPTNGAGASAESAADEQVRV